MSEVALTPETISRFRRNYIEAFGAPSRDDALYAAVSEGRRFAGMEHWLPFFYEQLDTLFDYLPDAPFVFDHLAREALAERHTLILDHYEARKKQGATAGMTRCRALQAGAAGPALSSPDEVGAAHAGPRGDRASRRSTRLMPKARRILHAGAQAGPQLRRRSAPTSRPTSSTRSSSTSPTCAPTAARWSSPAGPRARSTGWRRSSPNISLEQSDAGRDAGRCREAEAGAGRPRRAAARSRLRDRATSSSSPSRTFSATGWCAARSSASAPPISSPSCRRSTAGDIVVHVDHGIGRFIGLKTIEAAGAPHDCLEIHYAGDDRLFLPVENIELLSRYGSERPRRVLDKLGGGAWQARKAKLKKRLREMAGQLIRIAAERQMRAAPVLIAAGRALRRVRRALPL